jgi:hypothetical protein
MAQRHSNSAEIKLSWTTRYKYYKHNAQHCLPLPGSSVSNGSLPLWNAGVLTSEDVRELQHSAV